MQITCENYAHESFSLPFDTWKCCGKNFTYVWSSVLAYRMYMNLSFCENLLSGLFVIFFCCCSEHGLFRRLIILELFSPRDIFCDVVVHFHCSDEFFFSVFFKWEYDIFVYFKYSTFLFLCWWKSFASYASFFVIPFNFYFCNSQNIFFSFLFSRLPLCTHTM